MKRVISASLGEVVLKGKNRKHFLHSLTRRMKAVCDKIGPVEIRHEMGKIYVEGDPEKTSEYIRALKHVFGIVYISPCIETTNDLQSLKEAAIALIEEYRKDHEVRTFKVHTSRADKNYPMKSPEINRHLGGAILAHFEDLSVDVHNPDIYVYCDVKGRGYLYIERERAYGGLPLGTNGKGLLLLSGGIDSPVAGFFMAKRGVKVDAIHFHSYPFTSERAEEKVLDLARVLSPYTDGVKVHSINLLPIQKEINKHCPEEEMTIISRRFMVRIADRLAQKKGYMSLITGENLGQVASQTIHGITVTNHMTDLPIFRPLIGMDKIDIIRHAEEIGTYETSILPFEDCCTVFLPKHPSLRPTEEKISRSEEALDIDALVEEALENMVIHQC